MTTFHLLIYLISFMYGYDIILLMYGLMSLPLY